MDEQPDLVLGDSTVPHLSFVNIRSVATLADGNILVVNGGPPKELRIFDAAGGFIRSFGGDGSDPGQFELLADAWEVAPDSIVAFDQRLARVTWFSGSGEVLATRSADPIVSGQYLIEGRLSGNRWLLVENLGVEIDPEGRVLRGMAIASEDGSAIDTIGSLWEATMVETPQKTQVWPSFYPGYGVYLAHEGLIYRGYAREFVIDVLTPDGALRRRIRRIAPPRPMTDEIWTELFDHAIGELPPETQVEMVQRRLKAGRTEVLPSFGSSLLMDSEEHLWIQAFALPTDRSVPWSVFEPGGHYLGDVNLPAQFNPTEITSDRILGVWRDSLGVETIRRYQLHRSETDD